MKHAFLFAAPVAALVCVVTAPAKPAHAWGEIGHKVIARIAWDAMKPETRAKIIALLDAAPTDADLASLRPAGVAKPDADRVLFEASATWPDIMRAKKTDAEKARNAKYHHGPWHYYDIFFEMDESGKVTERNDMKNESENALVALNEQSATLADTAKPESDRAIAIAWIGHLVGDLHMPLHNVARISAENPKGDQGGNLVKLEPKPAGSGYQKNLHGFWDDLPDSQFPASPGEEKEARIARIALVAQSALPKTIFERAGLTQTGNAAGWNREGAELAITRVYPGVTPLMLPGDAYTREARDTALVGLAKAGYRLAATLEAALAGK